MIITREKKYKLTDFFPTSVKEIKGFGWDQADVILFTGDAYIDHPAFGTAIIARVLKKSGYRVAIVPQPNWRDDLRDFKKLGRPKLFFGVSSGNMDSMVNHYTANKRLRSNDAFTPGGKAGQRPDYAVSVYSKILKKMFPDVPVVLGGIEASLRRLTHYDYWSDSLKPSVLIDSDADLLVYGMAEKAVLEIAKRLKRGESIGSITQIPQTAFRIKEISSLKKEKKIVLGSYEECIRNKKVFADNFVIAEEESNKLSQAVLAEKTGSEWVIVNPAFPLLSKKEIDNIYSLPFTRLPHPRYAEKEPIPAYEMIKDSVTIHRGCFGGCSFCTISAHQGKFVSSRSKGSILKELEVIAGSPDFKGHITDLGGPSANMYEMAGIDLKQCAVCKRPSCLFPALCKNLNADHTPLIALYKEAIKLKGIKKITIGSGIRYDLIIDKNNKPVNSSGLEYFKELVINHVSGRLKVAPEHSSKEVLKFLRKPSFDLFLHLNNRFDEICRENGLRQQLIPYLISSLPASRIDEMAELAVEMQKLGIKLEQVQDFTPTPMTLASVMFYTGFDPYTQKEIPIPRSIKEKKIQQLFFFLDDKDKRKELKSELFKIKRQDIIKKLGL
ncbi:MAG: YgiQ family radical SAM protein [Bacteroidetes bacterium]|nr:YgiQ family radical SAM protein [Bacteroidota bacterium]